MFISFIDNVSNNFEKHEKQKFEAVHEFTM